MAGLLCGFCANEREKPVSSRELKDKPEEMIIVKRGNRFWEDKGWRRLPVMLL